MLTVRIWAVLTGFGAVFGPILANIGQYWPKNRFFGPGGGIAGRPCNSISQWRRLAQKSPTKPFLDINCIGFSLGAYRKKVVDFPRARFPPARVYRVSCIVSIIWRSLVSCSIRICIVLYCIYVLCIVIPWHVVCMVGAALAVTS